ncbi:hypothetical protein CEUSTIGMA_g7818.t1 [Chlamydomonas eustigma]|uniref:Kinesin-like protein n=1 Tax=Chlamydomonas eustigma TaxID=1157962 RepID=A0A250XBU7_9CHLO|nr:hypothetical protein CEUSTIGMA_g7818.t1 [Chlamydomonas eustigma]|eukprot:GAX80379.1 hypothetical protein CEUSTIGMA_g7818.t1 [Chlamydomonas eustigma]
MPSTKSECIKVVARCRPLSTTEINEQRKSIVSIVPPTSVKVNEDKAFVLDQVFGPDSTQENVFDTVAKPIVDAVLNGYNGTIFAYGQTGSGKTFTMDGSVDLPGIMPRTFEYIASQVATQSVGCQYVLYLSFLEIYNEEIIDLLVKGQNKVSKLEIKESKERGIYVNGLGQHVVTGMQDMMKKLQLGKKNRKVGETKMNSESSRSHSILTLTIVCVEGAVENAAAAAAAIVDRQRVGGPGAGGAVKKAAGGRVSVGKLNLVDLAGSERTKKTGAEGDRLKEGIAINKSLSALGNVMSILSEGKTSTVVPYRDSKLTRLLQDSLGGNSKTVMLANIGPADWNSEEILGTLKFAQRARNIKNDPKVNDDPGDAMIQQYKQEAGKLHAEYKAKIAKMEEDHALEVLKLQEELKELQLAKSAKTEEVSQVQKLQQQLQALQEEQTRRQTQEAEVAALKAQLLQLQTKAEEQQAAEAVTEVTAVAPGAVVSSDAEPVSAKEATVVEKPKKGNKYVAEINKLKDKISNMKMEAVSDYEYMMLQSDELARLRVKMLAESGQRRDADVALLDMQAEMAGLQGLTKLQEKELKRLQVLTENLQARSVRPSSARVQLGIIIQGDEHHESSTHSSPDKTAGSGRSLRDDPGCNMLFERLVLDMGYDAEASRQAIMAMPGGLMDEIIDYIEEKEAIMESWKSFKASVAVA